MYTIETLTKINSVYHANHRVQPSDVEKANMYVKIIERSRTDNNIQAGDIVEFIDKHGNYYRNGHIESFGYNCDNEWHICEQPQIPFVNLTDNDNNITCSTSGGAWTNIPSKLTLIGKRKKLFKVWGHCGACANGGLAIEAIVNVWEYKEPHAMYGDYTTKDYDKHYISYCVDEYGRPKDGSQYRYFGNAIAFVTKKDYEVWRDTFRGVEFAGNWPNQTVVFTYKRIEKLISQT